MYRNDNSFSWIETGMFFIGWIEYMPSQFAYIIHEHEIERLCHVHVIC